MELAGAQINANERSSGERRGAASERALHFQTKGSPVMENARPRRPWGPGAHLPSSPLPYPSPRVSPAFVPGRGWDKMAQTFEGGDQGPHSSLWKEMPSSGKGGRGYSVGGGWSPTPRCQPTHLRAAQHPHPSP